MRKSFRALPSHVLGAGKYSSGHYIVVVYWSKQFPSFEGNSERAETTGIKPFFTSPLHRCCCKMNGQAVVGKPHYQRVIWIVVRKIVSTWPIHWEKGMQDGWLRRGLCCSYTFVPSLPFFFIRHTQARWRNVMEKTLWMHNVYCERFTTCSQKNIHEYSSKFCRIQNEQIWIRLGNRYCIGVKQSSNWMTLGKIMFGEVRRRVNTYWKVR